MLLSGICMLSLRRPTNWRQRVPILEKIENPRRSQWSTRIKHCQLWFIVEPGYSRAHDWAAHWQRQLSGTFSRLAEGNDLKCISFRQGPGNHPAKSAANECWKRFKERAVPMPSMEDVSLLLIEFEDSWTK